MERPGNISQKKGTFLTFRSLLIALLFFLPIALPGLFGWLNGLLAVPIFLLLQTAAHERRAGEQMRNGLLMAGLASLVLGRIAMFLFTLTMLPLGYSLHLSSNRRQSPAETGMNGIITLGCTWLLFWAVYGTIAGINPYLALLGNMDAFMEQVVTVYRTNADLPAEVLYNLELIIAGIRELLPKILPGLLAGMVLATVSMNMVFSNALLRRLAPEKATWPPYGEWRLPDKVVWLLIFASALLLVGKGGVNNIGLSLVFISGVLYFFQGIAVVIHVLNRWNIPRAFRFLLYVFLVFQRYGMLLVAFVGVADTWADFRKLDHEDKTE
ncbi:MAG: DUF2232 domain-containing protein [Candidatus Electrothrix aestuarii]|uniref:DUF2232 domain-containing protein n=1 Tax=Candidatus Electrothrix aestuarii TaxID=3062594 RepID=A0AAU8M2F5_9BACT|nr:DUF2232 domain-containing protein [Candidatus Electrothrix aestuarii]